MRVQAEKKVCPMQVTETLSEGLKREYQVVVPAAELDAKVNARLDELKDRVRINGFRPGKVPVTHLKKIYGKRVMAETIDAVIRELNGKIVSERGLKLATDGEYRRLYQFLQVLVDMKNSTNVTAGTFDDSGHDYRGSLVPMFDAVLRIGGGADPSCRPCPMTTSFVSASTARACSNTARNRPSLWASALVARTCSVTSSIATKTWFVLFPAR